MELRANFWKYKQSDKSSAGATKTTQLKLEMKGELYNKYYRRAKHRKRKLQMPKCGRPRRNRESLWNTHQDWILKNKNNPNRPVLSRELESVTKYFSRKETLRPHNFSCWHVPKMLKEPIAVLLRLFQENKRKCSQAYLIFMTQKPKDTVRKECHRPWNHPWWK